MDTLCFSLVPWVLLLHILTWQPIISELALMDDVLGYKLTPKFWTAFKYFLPCYPMNTSTLQNPFYSSFCRRFQGMQCFAAISRPCRTPVFEWPFLLQLHCLLSKDKKANMFVTAACNTHQYSDQ